MVYNRPISQQLMLVVLSLSLSFLSAFLSACQRRVAVWFQWGWACEKGVCRHGLPSHGGIRLSARHHQPYPQARPQTQHSHPNLPRKIFEQDVRKRPSALRCVLAMTLLSWSCCTFTVFLFKIVMFLPYLKSRLCFLQIKKGSRIMTKWVRGNNTDCTDIAVAVLLALVMDKIAIGYSAPEGPRYQRAR